MRCDLADAAVWGPLRAVREHLHGEMESFMFMGLDEATGLYFYKHRGTRSYLVLDVDVDVDGQAHGDPDASGRATPLAIECAARVALGAFRPDAEHGPRFDGWWPGFRDGQPSEPLGGHPIERPPGGK